jgi:hypothetical protein
MDDTNRRRKRPRIAHRGQQSASVRRSTAKLGGTGALTAYALDHLCKHCPVRCKHCPDRIALTPVSSSYVHIEGDQAGKHTCAVNPYGFHAEPVGAPCGDHPANPCNGSRGIEPRP